MKLNRNVTRISIVSIMLLGAIAPRGVAYSYQHNWIVDYSSNEIADSGIFQTAQNDSETDNTLESKILEEINRARTNPTGYADWLEAQKQYYDGIMLKLPGENPVRSNRGLQALEEAIDFVRNQSPLNPLTSSAELENLAKEAVEAIGNNQSRREGLLDNISYGKVTPEAIVFHLVVDDGIRDRRHRLAVFSPNYHSNGIACHEHQVYQQICAIAYEETSENVATEKPSPPITNSESTPEVTTENNPTETIKEPTTKPREENTSPSNIPDDSSLSIASVERGLLEEGDKVIPNDGSLYDSYPLEGKAGDYLIISLESQDFDTFLAIMDSEGKILEQNDDISDSNSNSQLKVTIPSDGTYSIIINAYDQGGKGQYVLTVRR